MSQPLDKKPRTLPRVQRREIQHIEEGDNQIWAVSYADLLMVLLAFFVIFFSFDNSQDRKHGLQDLAQGLRSAGFEGAKNPNSKTGAEQGAAQPEAAANPEVRLISQYLTAIDNQKVQVDGEHIQILLPDDAFAKGQYQLSPELKTRLDQIYETLRPFERDLEIVVIGHADSTPFAVRHNEYLGDNFDLSSLRSLRALQYVLGKGFPHDQISAQGAADGGRKSRTLSLKVSWKETRK
ncbi:MAG: OmpA family protein [Bdellovibrionota bacterium]